MGEQFALDLALELVDNFPQASCRYIKGLAKLTAKYCNQKQVGPSLKVFKRCAVFRGLDLVVTSD